LNGYETFKEVDSFKNNPGSGFGGHCLPGGITAQHAVFRPRSSEIEIIDELDAQLLSGGAGAKRQLTEYREEEIAAVGHNYPAGRTPDEAWHTLIRSWENKVRDPNLGVYTQITRLAYRDFKNLPDSRYEEDVNTYKDKPYEVIRNDTYAVIFFGKKKGWDNAPFLFCRTAAGWQFDIVHQRKYVRMGRNPQWGIERADYPYVDLLSKCPYWMNQDIPREGDDIYRIEDDERLADEIKRLEKAYESHSEDFATVMQLGKLYAITSLSPQKRMSFLKKAKQLNPDSPEPYKYLGIVHLDAFYQFESALKEMEEYVRRRPRAQYRRAVKRRQRLCLCQTVTDLCRTVSNRLRR